jgi:glycosyltransferase involved in cell wall biosynthesis
MPKISVIIPVFNGEKTIKETIDSVLAQTFTDFELLVINDGSQDETLIVLATIKDARLKVFSYPNGGPSICRNRGIEQATGDYISFIDADDLWTPDKLAAQLQALQENPQASVAYSFTDWIDENGQRIHQGSYTSVNGNIYARLLLNDFIESGSNPLICKTAFDEVGMFNPTMGYAEDWDMWLRLAARYEFVSVKAPQVLYRMVRNSQSSNINKMAAGSFQAIANAFNQAPENLQQLKKYTITNRCVCLAFFTLERSINRTSGLTAAQLMWRAIKSDPSLLRAKVLIKVFLKIAIMVIFPHQQSQALLSRLKSFLKINALFGYLTFDPLEIKGFSANRDRSQGGELGCH